MERRSVAVQPAVEADIPVVQGLCASLMQHVKQWSTTLDPDWVHSESGLEYFRNCVTDPKATLLKATVGQEIAGFAAGFITEKPYRLERRFADLDFFYVDDRFRKQGVGRILVSSFSEWCITESDYNKKREEYRGKQKEIQKKMGKLQVADEEDYITSDYILNLASRAPELFESSESQEKRQLIKFALQNLRLEGRLVRYDEIKPFDRIRFYASRQLWLPIPDNIILTFQNPSQTGELRQRWEEIKKLSKEISEPAHH